MSAKRLEVSLRHEPGVCILDLHGEINALAEETLNAAYAEAEQQNATYSTAIYFYEGRNHAPGESNNERS